MKTKYIYTAALVVMAAVMLAVPFRAVGAQSGAATPQELGNKELEAIKAQNKDALKSLVHPQVVAYIEQNNTGDLDKVLDNLLSTPIPVNTEFVVRPMEEVSEYDKATQTLTLSDNALFFPIPPSDLLVIVTEKEIPKKDEKGVETKVKAKVGLMVNTITQYNKNWYIVLPMIKKETPPAEGKQEQKQQ